MNGQNEQSHVVDDDGVTRRRLLRLGLLAAGAGAVAIPAGTLGGYNRAAAEGVGRAANSSVVVIMFLIFIEEIIIVQFMNWINPGG